MLTFSEAKSVYFEGNEVHLDVPRYSRLLYSW